MSKNTPQSNNPHCKSQDDHPSSVESKIHTYPSHGYVLTLFGQEWHVRRSALPGSAIAQLSVDEHSIIVSDDINDAEFMPHLLHELTEYVLEELGCHYSNFEQEHIYQCNHRQMDNVVQLVYAAVQSLRLEDTPIYAMSDQDLGQMLGVNDAE